ncbi:hypothetical protein L0Y59_00020, partial [Candidatus Uhrbacteria bacterium]|nr:hypothetical protein [Candidatus Uhrbacteria bacterium]
MKRAVLGALGGTVIVGIFLLWWVGRDTPEKALHDAIRKLASARSIGHAALDVTWTDATTRVTTGWTAVGQVDLEDVARPQALGVVRTSQGVFGPSEQTADAILTDDRIALRPRDVSAEYRSRYLDITGDKDVRRFVTLQRDPFLDGKGLGAFIAHGDGGDIRKVL